MDWEDNYDASVAYKIALNMLADWARQIANRQWAQYAKCYMRCSNNRGRYFKINAYWYLSLGLMQLSVNVDPKEKRTNKKGLYRVCTKYLSAELIQ